MGHSLNLSIQMTCGIFAIIADREPKKEDALEFVEGVRISRIIAMLRFVQSKMFFNSQNIRSILAEKKAPFNHYHTIICY